MTQENTSKSGSVKKFSCPTCDAKVNLSVVGQTVNAVCGSCNSVIDPTDGNFRVIEKYFQKGQRTQFIPLGSRGAIEDVTWEVIGYMERQDVDSSFTWSEYLLYNPYHGFRWLTESDGHWNFVSPTKSKPDISESDTVEVSSFQYGQETYRLYHRGTAKVIYVVGEFYWQLKQGEEVKVADYISPPMLLSMEKNNSEVVWSTSKYLDSKSVQSGFMLIGKDFPYQIGVAPNQPSPYLKHKGTGRAWASFFMVFVLFQMGSMIFAKNKEVFSKSFKQLPEDSGKLFTSEPFQIKNGPGNVEISTYAFMNNSWLEVQGELVNDDDGRVFEFDQTLEYYSGYESGSSWTEGSPKKRNVISKVPNGNYHLNIDVAHDPLYGPIQYQIKVKRNVIIWSNFFAALVLISIYPFFYLLLKHSYEVKRWSNSDHSPYDES